MCRRTHRWFPGAVMWVIATTIGCAQTDRSLPMEPPNDRRAKILEQAFGPHARVRESTHFSIAHDPAAEALVPLALETLEQAHDDVSKWCEMVDAPFEIHHGKRHWVMLFGGNNAYVRATPNHAPDSAKGGMGFYHVEDESIFWYDQRTGPQQVADINFVGRERDGVNMQEQNLLRAKREGVGVRIGLGGHAVPERSIADAESYVAMLREQNNRRSAWLATLEAGVRPRYLRHEAAHQFLFEHGAMAHFVPTWLTEGMAILFEEVDRSTATPRPSINRRRLSKLRIHFVHSRGIDISTPDVVYEPRKLAEAFNLREMVHNNFITQRGRGEGDIYYARYWAFTFYLAERRPADLLDCLAQTLQTASVAKAETPTSIRQFEAVFGDDYESLAGDFGEFLVEILKRDDAQAEAEEVAWRDSRKSRED